MSEIEDLVRLKKLVSKLGMRYLFSSISPCNLNSVVVFYYLMMWACSRSCSLDPLSLPVLLQHLHSQLLHVCRNPSLLYKSKRSTCLIKCLKCSLLANSYFHHADWLYNILVDSSTNIMAILANSWAVKKQQSRQKCQLAGIWSLL